MTVREGNLEAPRAIRRMASAGVLREAKLLGEMERVFSICHGCRRCVNLFTAFPTLFVSWTRAQRSKSTAWKSRSSGRSSTQCYLCDMCYMTKPVVRRTPGTWISRPDAAGQGGQVRERAMKLRDRLCLRQTPSEARRHPGRGADRERGHRNAAARSLMEKAIGVHPERKLPPTVRHVSRDRRREPKHEARNGERTREKSRYFRPAT